MKKAISILALSLLVASTAVAQMAPPVAPRAGKVLADYLQLTADQVTAWQQINRDTAAAVQPLAANVRDLRQQLDTALKAVSPDPTAIGKLAVSLHGVQEQIRTLHETAKSKRLALLTADQKAKFAAFEAAAQFMRQQRRRVGPGPGR